MKSTIISMAIVLVVLMVVPFFLLKNGDLLEKFGFGGESSGDSIKELKAKVPKNVQTVTSKERIEIYKWVDEHGVTQFSHTPPLEGASFEKMELSPNTNVIDAFKTPEKEQEEVAKPDVFSVGSPYSPDGMKKMIDDSQSVQETLNQRQVDQEKILQDLLKRKK
ncbi:MAG: DUF4124 domain-containing protein [Gammaproteobacteria bacterium]|nr:DUF4124 domain-containing protein [Gammaproteobacteria bacterium]